MRKNFDCEITKNILIKALNIKKYIYFITKNYNSRIN